MPEPQDSPRAAPQVDEADTELDALEHDLDAVDAALDALDADDLDAAESLVAGLVDDPPDAPAD